MGVVGCWCKGSWFCAGMGVAKYLPGQGPWVVYEPVCSWCDAVSVIFNLPDYQVLDAIDLPSGGRRVIVRVDAIAGGCPGCRVVSARVHAWRRQRVKDLPHAGDVELVVVKLRLVCVEHACTRRMFTPSTPELLFRARCTSRLRQAMLKAVIGHGRPVARVAASFNVAWWTAQKTVNSAIDTLHIIQRGIDEHRYRKVRWFRAPDSWVWVRIESWMTTIVNTRCGQVRGVVDGRTAPPSKVG